MNITNNQVFIAPKTSFSAKCATLIQVVDLPTKEAIASRLTWLGNDIPVKAKHQKLTRNTPVLIANVMIKNNQFVRIPGTYRYVQADSIRRHYRTL